MRATTRGLGLSGAFAVLALAGLAACGGDPTPSPTPTATPVPQTTPTESMSGSEQEWADTVAAAKNEKLVLNTFTDPPLAELLEMFEEEFGITVEQTTSRPSQSAPQILTEQQSDQYNWDILWHPVSNIGLTLKPSGGLEPILDYLILDEVANPDMWYGGLTGQVPEDPLTSFYDGILGPGTGFEVNYDIIPESEAPKDWLDLVDPKYEGKIGIYFPPRVATATIGLACMRDMFGSQAEWEQYLRDLFALEPTADSSFPTVGDWIAQGRFPITIGGDSSHLDNLQRELNLNIGDGLGTNTCIGSPAGSGRIISVAKNPPNPNATAVFVNWALTKRIQDLTIEKFWAEGTKNVSRRVDAAHPDPAFQQAAVDAFDNQWMTGNGRMITTERTLDLQQRVLEIAKEFGY